MSKKSAIVIGAGIIGLATARALAVRNYRVTVIERDAFANGASVRNFGMIWPIGQREGAEFERAKRSRSIWQQVCTEARIWYDPVGSLHLAYDELEWRVICELGDVFHHRGYKVLNKEATICRSEAVLEKGLKGSLYSADEMIVDPRKTSTAIAEFLKSKYKVEFHFSTIVTAIDYPKVICNEKEWEADKIFICTGADYDGFYGNQFRMQAVTRCKLQMMRMIAQPGDWRIGPALCGALSLAHYKSFEAAPSLADLKKRFEDDYPEYLRWGIHVMVSQMQAGELIIGDSHEYGQTPDPFGRHFINEMILDYLKTFTVFPNPVVTESWHGVYTKLTDGRTHCVLEPESGVTIINGLGGAGMTLSFGLCEELIASG
ncbi:TIGR03364 family FAD-dependent oxidoreductase [Pollutibacter soli]|uniref:TIGR03364 family FAD-dependent oxidoreductase n=1 Tax=Pollutibacter soli TaxID=3034157 RepID=UPI003013F1D2